MRYAILRAVEGTLKITDDYYSETYESVEEALRRAKLEVVETGAAERGSVPSFFIIPVVAVVWQAPHDGRVVEENFLNQHKTGA